MVLKSSHSDLGSGCHVGKIRREGTKSSVGGLSFIDQCTHIHFSSSNAADMCCFTGCI